MGDKAFRQRDGFQRFLRRGDGVRQRLVFKLQDEYRGASIRQGLALGGACALFAATLWLGAMSWVATLAICGVVVGLSLYSMLPGLERRMVSEQLAELAAQPGADSWGPPSVLIGIGLAVSSLLLAIFRLG